MERGNHLLSFAPSHVTLVLPNR